MRWYDFVMGRKIASEGPESDGRMMNDMWFLFAFESDLSCLFEWLMNMSKMIGDRLPFRFWVWHFWLGQSLREPGGVVFVDCPPNKCLLSNIHSIGDCRWNTADLYQVYESKDPPDANAPASQTPRTEPCSFKCSAKHGRNLITFSMDSNGFTLCFWFKQRFHACMSEDHNQQNIVSYRVCNVTTVMIKLAIVKTDIERNHPFYPEVVNTRWVKFIALFTEIS